MATPPSTRPLLSGELKFRSWCWRRGEVQKGDAWLQTRSWVTSLSDRSDLTDSEYHALADEDMDTLHEGLEVLCEEYAPSTDWEVEYSVSGPSRYVSCAC